MSPLQPLGCRLLVLGTAGCVLALGQSAVDLCRQAQADMVRGNYIQALQQAEQALRADPRSGQAESLLGAAAFALGDFEAAAKHSLRALELQPDTTQARRTLGATFLKQRRYSDARREFQKLVAIRPEDFVALYSLGLTFLLEDQPAEAITQFERAAKLEPHDPTLLSSVLEARVKLKQWTEAASTLAQLDAQIPPRDPRRVGLTAMLANAGAYDLAIPEFQRLLEEQPESYEFRFNLALAYHRSGKETEAAEIIRRMLARQENAELQDLLGEVEQARGDRPQSLAAFRRAAELDPRSEDYRYDYAQALAQQLELNQSLAAFQRAATDFPRSRRMLLGLGATEYLAGKYADATATLLRVAEVAPREPRVYYLLGRIYDAAGSGQPSISARFASYLSGVPTDAWAQYFYGRILAMQNRERAGDRLESARGHLRRAITLDNSLAEAHAELGNVLERQGQLQAAREELERAVHLDPGLSTAYYHLAQVYRKLGEETLANKTATAFRQLKSQERVNLDRAQIQRFLERAKP